MFTNYLKIAIRSMLRERYYTLIKITGLALGLGTSMVLFLYVSYQLSFDTFHRDVDRIYRVNQTSIWDPKGGIFNSTGLAVAGALKEDFPEIEEIMRVNTPGNYTVRYEKPGGDILSFNEDRVFAADSNFFSIFDFKLKEGDPATALMGLNKIVLSAETAQKLFGDEPALGKYIHLSGEKDHLMEVTGVTVTQPSNSHFNFDYLYSIYSNPNIKRFEWSWIWTQVVTYVKLRPGADAVALDEKLKTFAERHAPECFKLLGIDYNEFMKDKGSWKLYLQPMKDIYLYSVSPGPGLNPIGNRIGSVGDINYIYIFSAVSGFILLIAVINFINLSTARGAQRAKEVGVKKTLGMMRTSLIAQFQTEHILITAVSMLLGMGVMELLRLVIQPWVGIEIPLSAWSVGTFASVIIITPVVIGFLAGLYPSFYLTAFRPSQVLKGKLATGFRSSKLRNALVVFQFTISIGLMVGTMVVFRQLDYFQSKDLGFDKENLLLINYTEKLGTHMESFRDEIVKLPGVVDAAVSMNIRLGTEDIYSSEGDDKKVTISHYKIDDHFFNVTKLKLVTGRTFDINRPSDATAGIINEASASQLGWTPEEALGKRIIYPDGAPIEVIGVVKDFHFQSLRQNIMPLIFFDLRSKMWDAGWITMIRYKAENPSELISKIEQRWNQVVNGVSIEYSFFDQELKQQYQQEQQLGALFSIFTGLSITIAVIGLVGLVSYSAEQRKKEIGIRKVFGASLSSIYVMINTQYIRLVVIALFIATPVSWWFMKEWLETFAYRTSIDISVFLLAGLAELVLALICVGYLALRAASLNPSAVLKEE
jgi:putative ABC transport system permease protein